MSVCHTCLSEADISFFFNTSNYIYDLTHKQKQAAALRELRKLAGDRDAWAGFTKDLCGVMEKL